MILKWSLSFLTLNILRYFNVAKRVKEMPGGNEEVEIIRKEMISSV